MDSGLDLGADGPEDLFQIRKWNKVKQRHTYMVTGARGIATRREGPLCVTDPCKTITPIHGYRRFGGTGTGPVTVALDTLQGYRLLSLTILLWVISESHQLLICRYANQSESRLLNLFPPMI